jgi:hypothetical protein
VKRRCKLIIAPLGFHFLCPGPRTCLPLREAQAAQLSQRIIRPLPVYFIHSEYFRMFMPVILPRSYLSWNFGVFGHAFDYGPVHLAYNPSYSACFFS